MTYISDSLAARIITDIDRRIDTCIALFGDVIYGRLKAMELYGDKWVDKPVGARYSDNLPLIPRISAGRHATMADRGRKEYHPGI